MSEVAQQILKDWQRLLGERANWDAHWQQIADRCCPRLGDFTTLRASGERRTEKMFDSTAALAAETFAAALGAMITPREAMWHGLRSGIAELDRIPRVQRFFEQLNSALFYYRYSPRANFENQFHEVRMMLGLFGTAPFWVDEVPGEGLVYRAIHMAEVVLEENHHGLVDTTYRKGRLPARQWPLRWPGCERQLPSIRDALANNQGDRVFEFVHCLRPRKDRDPERPDWRGMAVESITVSCTDQMIVKQGGYRTMPLLVPRFTASPREPYGRSPAMMALPDIKMANEMRRTLLRAAHRAVTPPLLTADDGIFSKLSLKPDAINVGGVDMNGRPTVMPLQGGGSVQLGKEMLDDTHNVIERAFLVPLFSILSPNPPDRMTATEVMERAKEKGVLLRPAAGKIEAEVLGPMIEREVDILFAAGLAPDIPPELLEARGEYRITYDNPLQRAQRAERSIGTLRTIEALAPVIPIRPEIADMFQWKEIVPGLAADNAMPPSWVKTPEEMDEDEANRQMQAQAAQLLQGAEMAGQAAVNMAKAQEIAGAAGV